MVSQVTCLMASQLPEEPWHTSSLQSEAPPPGILHGQARQWQVRGVDSEPRPS